MCVKCKANDLAIRDQIFKQEHTAGRVYSAEVEYGCWACDGDGRPISEVQLDPPSHRSPSFVVYSVPRRVIPREKFVKKIVAEATRQRLRFEESGACKWAITISSGNERRRTWSYMPVPDDVCLFYSPVKANHDQIQRRSTTPPPDREAST